MIAELIPEAYDILGRSASPSSRKHKRLFEPNFPIGRYISQPLRHECSSLREIRKFLKDCKYVSDEELFGRDDFWQPPERFEELKKGDCDDFALWTWRQLLAMGYRARYVVGEAGKYGDGHAWVTMQDGDRWYLVEPQDRFYGDKIPRLRTLRYKPRGSVEWRDGRPHYFVHEERNVALPFGQHAALVASSITFWSWFWLRILVLLVAVPVLIPYRLSRRGLRRLRNARARTPDVVAG